MADMTDVERIAEERIEEAARTGQGWLDLGDLELTKLPDALSTLTKLKRLSLGDFHQVTAEGVNHRKGLHVENTFSDVGVISSLSELRELYIDGTEVSDLTPIKNLLQLQHLVCRGTNISDLTPIKGLLQLQYLDCSFIQVSDLTPITGLLQLQRLDCGLTKVSDLTPIKGLLQLQHLACSDTNVSDLTPMKGLLQLKGLFCGRTKVSDLTPIKDLLQLQRLYCRGTQVSDLTPIKNLQQLQRLDCSGTKVSNLTPIAKLQKLQHLDCEGTKVSDLSPIAKLQALYHLDCSMTAVGDLSPIAKIINLTRVKANNCSVASLPSAIKNLQMLQLLDLRENQIRTLPRELGELTNLESFSMFLSPEAGPSGLWLEGNPLEDPLPELIAPGQPQATINVLRWLRGEPIEPEATEPDPPAPEERADDPPAIPEQGAGPRVVLDQTGRLLFAKPSDLDAKGNDRHRLEALHPTLREAAAELTKALQDHPSNLRNERLLQKAEAYRALVDLPLDEVNFARLYGAGMQLLNAAAATREALDASRVDVPDLTPSQNECLKNIEGLHPPFVLASRDGQDMLADQTTIKLTADHVLAVKEAGTAFGEALLHRPDLAAPGIGQTIKDAAAEIGQGGNPAREAVNAVSSARNTVVVAAWIATAASLTVGGAAYYGSPGAVLGMIPGVLLIESVKSSAIFKDITKRGAKMIDWSDEKIAALGARIKHWQELLGQNDGHLRKLAQVPKFEWLGPFIDWLKRNSPPDKKE